MFRRGATQFGCCWDLTYSAGFRYVEYNEINGVLELAGAETVFNRVNMEGIGLTVATELRNQFSCNLGWFLNLRFSAIMGDEDNRIFEGDQNGPEDSLSLTQRNDVKFIYEAQAGAEYIAPICGGGYYFLRGGVEVQWWDDFGVDNLPASSAEDIDEKPFGGFDNYGVGFAGFFIAVGVQR